MNGMTAYSSNELYTDTFYLSTEIKTVNNRFLDIYVYMPNYLNSFEVDIRNLIQQHILRGKVDVSITLKTQKSPKSVTLDESLAKQYYDALSSLSNFLEIDDKVKLFHLTRFDGIINTENTSDYDQFWEAIQKSLHHNLEEIKEQRLLEGKSTYQSILKIINDIDSQHKDISLKVPVMEKEIYSTVKTKVTELIGDHYDENKILTEAAVMVTKACINEEVERLKAHIEHFRKVLDSDNDIGKKLDFICQEMFREINTIGSKISLVELSQNVIAIKYDIEKIRELLRNIE